MGIRVLIYFLVCIEFTTPREITFVADIIRSYDRPTVVNAILCWDLYRMKKLTNFLKVMSIPKTIKFSGLLDNDVNLHDSMFIFNKKCPNGTEILKQAAQQKLFRNFKRWLVLDVSGSEKETDVILDLELDKLNISIDSEFIIATNKHDGITIDLKLAYKISPNTSLLFENYGSWTIEQGLRKADQLSISIQMRRKNLERHVIKTSYVVTVNSTRYMLDDMMDPSDIITKCCYRIVLPLYDFVNVTNIVVFAETWGYFVNGSWNGMMGHIVNGEADIAGTVVFMIPDRLPLIDYLMYAVDSTKTRIVFRDPPLSYQNNLFLLPFNTSVWMCTGAFILILLFILYVNANWELKAAESSRRCSVSDVAMMVLGAVSQQGFETNQELKGTIGRLVMLILFLAFLFLHTSYSASVVVLLQSSSSDIRTLSDLLNSKLELGVQDVPYNHHYFKRATEPVRKALYETKVAGHGSQKDKFMTVEEGVDKMRQEPFAFNMFLGVGYKVVQRKFLESEKCGLHEISYIPQTDPWIASAKNSPYKELFKVGFLRIREHGLIDREQRLMFEKKPVCAVAGGSFASVSFIDVYPAILMLLYGYLFSFALLLIEIFIHRLQVKCNRNRPYSSSSADTIRC